MNKALIEAIDRCAAVSRTMSENTLCSLSDLYERAGRASHRALIRHISFIVAYMSLVTAKTFWHGIWLMVTYLPYVQTVTHGIIWV